MDDSFFFIIWQMENFWVKNDNCYPKFSVFHPKIIKNFPNWVHKNNFVGSYLRDYVGLWETDFIARKCQICSTKMVIVTC